MKRYNAVSAPPKRAELSDTPIKFCHEISRLFRQRLREKGDNEAVLSQHGARLTLSFLAIRDGVTQRDLVQATHLRAPTVSVILKHFEEDGLVERRSDVKDRRAVRVFLTKKGRALDRRNIAHIREVDDEVLSVLSREENEQLMLLLTKLRDRLIDLQESTEEDTL